MTWSNQRLNLAGIEYQVSRAITSGAPEAGDLYRTMAGGDFVYVALPAPGAVPLSPADAEQVRALSGAGFLPVRELAWAGDQPAFVFGKARLVPLDQGPPDPRRSPKWLAEEIRRLAEAVDRFQQQTGSAAFVRPDRVLSVEPGPRLTLLPPLALDRRPAAQAEDLRQLALVAAWVLTGTRQMCDSLAAAEDLAPAPRAVLARACAGGYGHAADFARDLASTFRSVRAAAPIPGPDREPGQAEAPAGTVDASEAIAEDAYGLEIDEGGAVRGMRSLLPILALLLIAGVVLAGILLNRQPSAKPRDVPVTAPVAQKIVATASPTAPVTAQPLVGPTLLAVPAPPALPAASATPIAVPSDTPETGVQSPSPAPLTIPPSADTPAVEAVQPEAGPTNAPAAVAGTAALVTGVQILVDGQEATEVRPGQQVDYVITVRNPGPEVAREVLLACDSPAWGTVISSELLQTATGWQQSWPEIAAGADEFGEIILEVGQNVQDGASLALTCQVSAAGSGEPLQVSSALTARAGPPPAVQLLIQPDALDMGVGETASFVVSVQQGGAPAAGVETIVGVWPPLLATIGGATVITVTTGADGKTEAPFKALLVGTGKLVAAAGPDQAVTANLVVRPVARIISDVGVKLRSGPRADSPVAARANNNDAFAILAQQSEGTYTWWQVRLPDGTPAWIREDLVKVDGSVESVPMFTPTTTPTVTPTTTATRSPTVVAGQAQAKAKRNANLRGGPGTNYPVVGQVKAGQVLDIVARNQAGSWYRLANDRWIFGELVVNAPKVPAATSMPPPPVQAAAPAPTPAAQRWVLVADSAADFPGGPDHNHWYYLWTDGRNNFNWQAMTQSNPEDCYRDVGGKGLEICRDSIRADPKGDVGLQWKASRGGTYRFEWDSASLKFYQHANLIGIVSKGSELPYAATRQGVIDWEMFFWVAADSTPYHVRVFRLDDTAVPGTGAEATPQPQTAGPALSFGDGMKLVGIDIPSGNLRWTGLSRQRIGPV